MTIVEDLVVAPSTPRSCYMPSPAIEKVEEKLEKVEEAAPAPPRNHLPGLNDAEQGCWQAFLGSSALLLEALDRHLAQAYQLRLFDFLVLGMLSRSNAGSARMGDLADALSVGPSRMTQLIHRLEAQGLVRRTRSMKDKRGVVATITREGRVRLQPATKTYAKHVHNNYLDQMSRQQMIAMGDSCRRINYPLNNSQKFDRFKPV